MSTRALIAIPTPTGDWLHVYCHYDGYPSHMLPALAHHAPDAILAAKEIRQVCADQIEAFASPRAPTRHGRPTLLEGICHLYAWDPDAGTFQHIQAA
jgi:hypothetical protein